MSLLTLQASSLATYMRTNRPKARCSAWISSCRGRILRRFRRSSSKYVEVRASSYIVLILAVRLDIERCSAAGQTNQHLTLTQISIHFRWTTSSDSTSDSSPFATRLSLAHRSLLSDAIHRFATYHLVRSVPLPLRICSIYLT